MCWRFLLANSCVWISDLAAGYSRLCVFWLRLPARRGNSFLFPFRLTLSLAVTNWNIWPHLFVKRNSNDLSLDRFPFSTKFVNYNKNLVAARAAAAPFAACLTFPLIWLCSSFLNFMLAANTWTRLANFKGFPMFCGQKYNFEFLSMDFFLSLFRLLFSLCRLLLSPYMKFEMEKGLDAEFARRKLSIHTTYETIPFEWG